IIVQRYLISPSTFPQFKMSSILLTFSAILFATCIAQDNTSQPTTLSRAFYSSAFMNPEPPNIQSEFRANYMQIYLSPSQQKIRADGASDGLLEVSIFDFTNTTANGTVANSILSFNGGTTQATCSSFLCVAVRGILP
ncbi:hypothetical protein CPB84DRAFT_1769293, partial [Gymnopilus junonius]